MKAGQDGQRQSWGDWTPTFPAREEGGYGRTSVCRFANRTLGGLLVAASSSRVKSVAVPSVVSKEEW